MNNVCSICSENVPNTENKYVTDCHHLYHSKCLFQYLYENTFNHSEIIPCCICQTDISNIIRKKLTVGRPFALYMYHTPKLSIHVIEKMLLDKLRELNLLIEYNLPPVQYISSYASNISRISTILSRNSNIGPTNTKIKRNMETPKRCYGKTQ